MKLYIYRGLDKEKVPKDVTHVIVDSSVTVIKFYAFHQCKYLVSVIMGDNVKRIEQSAFWGCIALRFIRPSKKLEYIGYKAFEYCLSLEALFLPSTVNEIGYGAFIGCRSLKLLVLPQDIDLNNVGYKIIDDTAILRIAGFTGIHTCMNLQLYTGLGTNQPNTWLIHHMDEAPFHKLCYDSTINTKAISHYINTNGNNSALQIDPYHGMTPLHMLSMNPHAPADTIYALLNANTNAVHVEDNQGRTPLYYALHFNPCALARMFSCLREHGIENEIQSLLTRGRDDDDSGWSDDDPGCATTPLHVLAQNPCAPADTIAALLEMKMEEVFRRDHKGNLCLDYAKEYNVDGLISMIAVLCNHRNSTASMENKTASMENKTASMENKTVSMENKTVKKTKKRKILDWITRFRFKHNMM
jgi:hypothetical protein